MMVAPQKIVENVYYAKKYDGKRNGPVLIECLNNSIEIIYEGSAKEPECIKYSDKNFVRLLDHALRKCGIEVLQE